MEAGSATEVEVLREQLQDTQSKLDRECKRTYALAEELRLLKEQNITVNSQVELEEEAITNKLMKRLSQLKQEKQALANEVEQEEEFLTNTLQKKLQSLTQEKLDLEKQLEAEEAYIVNKLQKQLDELAVERMKLSREKVDLENQLEAEQEYIVNKLQKQVDGLALEKKDLTREHEDMKKQVRDLAAEKERLNKEKAHLENTLEAEEENIVNRLQKQIEEMAFHYMVLERKYEALTCGKTTDSDASEDEHHGHGPRNVQRSLSHQIPSRSPSGSQRSPGGRYQQPRLSLPNKYSPQSVPQSIVDLRNSARNYQQQMAHRSAEMSPGPFSPTGSLSTSAPSPDSKISMLGSPKKLASPKE